MKLQLALDQVDLGEALRVTAELESLIDIVEIGTPLIIREGVRAVAAVKERFPALTVLADVKIMDGGEIESRISFEAGADIVTVLGLAHDVTLAAAVREAGRQGRSVMVDLLGVADLRGRIAQVESIGAGYVCVHTASDLQGSGRLPARDPLRALEEAVAAARAAQVAVAGGITAETVAEVARRGPQIVIVGGGILKDPNRREAARRVRERLP